MKQTSKQQLAVRKKKSRIPKQLNPQHLRELQDQLHVNFTFRYITTGTGGSASTTVTYTNLLDSWIVSVGTTAGRQLFDFIKIRRVTIRAVSNPALAGNVSFLGPAATVGVEFPGLVAGTQGSGKQVSDSAMGTNNVAMATLTPDRYSPSAQWQASSSNVAFVLRATDWNAGPIVGAIIDVDVSLKNSSDVNPASPASALAGLTTGEFYYRGIDGAAPAATWARSVFVPRA